MKWAWGLAVAMNVVACSNFYVDTADILRDANKQNLKKLTLGMEKQSAMATMGTEPSRGVFMWIDNPHHTEQVTAKDGQRYEALYYYTELKQRDDKITDDELTPLLFKNGKLVAWGDDARKILGK